MADPSSPWAGPSVLDLILNSVVAVVAFLSGTWSRGVAKGEQEATAAAQIHALAARMTVIESRSMLIEDKLAKTIDRIDEKMSKIAERLAATPTRDEMMAMSSRFESKLDARGHD